MKKEKRTVVYDEVLQVEAYQLEGYLQPFPNHYHEYYVIGYMEAGERCMSCLQEQSIVSKGDVIIFNPGDNHGCSPHRNLPMDYRSLNISKDRMLELCYEITQERTLPRFTIHHTKDEELICYLKPLFSMIMDHEEEFEKEEYLFLLLDLMIRKYSCSYEETMPESMKEIDAACAYMEAHYQEAITLDELAEVSHISKSTLLRYFTKCKGVTPYRYLEMKRISEAKKCLEKGMSPLEAALQTGFSDQSHFTNYFSRFIGLPPGVYQEIFKRKKEEQDEQDA